MSSLINIAKCVNWRGLCLTLILGGWQLCATAHVPTDAEPAEVLSRAVAASEAVLHGVVVGVDYGVAEGEENLPYTYVTYQVRQAVRGRSAEEKITLRFIGGPDGKGRYLTVSGVPLFNVGDEDILLIQGHGSDDCPLVYCEYGRFQVHEGKVYNARGFPVTNMSKGRLRYGEHAELAVLRKSYPVPDFNALMKNEAVQKQLREQLSDSKTEELRTRYAREAPQRVDYAVELGTAKQREDTTSDGKGDSAARQLTADTGERANAIGVERFIEALTKIAARQTDRDSLKALRSITPATRFTTRVPRESEPQAAVVERQRAPADDKERHELELLRAQEFNPVIPHADRQPEIKQLPQDKQRIDKQRTGGEL